MALSYVDHVPSDIWWRVMLDCGPAEVLALELTCKKFRSLSNDKSIWTRCLQNLGPLEPPSLAPHFNHSDLSQSDLRRISVRAVQKSRAWEERPDDFYRATREAVLFIKDTNPDDVLGEPLEFGLELFLLPGADHLVASWPAGYIQLWSLADRSCKFLYPSLPDGRSEDRPKLLACFAHDVQPNGDIHLLLMDEYLQEPEMGDRYPVVVKLSVAENYAVQTLHEGRQLNRAYGIPHMVKLQGNTFAVYQKFFGTPTGALTVHFFDGRCIELTETNIDCFDFADEFIVCVCRLQSGDMSAVALDLSQLSELAVRPADDSPESIRSVRLADATCMTSAVLLQPKSFSLRKSELSINTQFWRDDGSERVRDKIFISVLHKDVVTHPSPIVHLVLQKEYSPAGSLCGALLSHVPPLDSDSDSRVMIGQQAIEKFRTINVPTLSGVSLVLLDPVRKDVRLIANDQPLPAYANSLSTTPLTGRTLTLLREEENGEDTRYLGAMKFVPGESPRLKPLSLGPAYDVMQSVVVEHYTGAIAFATQQFDKIVVKYPE